MDLIAKARRMLEAGQYAEARAACRRILAARPNQVDALVVLGIAAGESGKIDEAIASFRRAANILPRDPAIRLQLGLALTHRGAHAEALAAFRASLALGLRHPQVYDCIGAALASQRDSEGAAAAYRESLTLWPGRVETLMQLSALHRGQGQWRESKDYSGQAAGLQPGDFRAHGQYADACLALGERDGAIDAYRRALALSGGSQQDRTYFEDRIADAVMVDALMADFAASMPERAAADAGAGAGEQPHPVAAKGLDDSRDEGRSEGRSEGKPQSFVFFHADLGEAHPFANLNRSEFETRIDYRDSLAIAVRAIRACVRDSRVVLLTGAGAAAAGWQGFDQVIEVAVDPNRLMYSRMQAYRDLCRDGQLRGPASFLDTDIFVVRDPAAVFDGGFDVALTYRRHPAFHHMPINEGVILAAHGASREAVRFFDSCLGLYDRLAENAAVRTRYGFDVRHWRGGQLALAAFVGWRTPPFAAPDATIDGVRVRFLPCDDYNHAVSAGDDFARLDAKRALHFKGGPAKSLMSSYARHRGIGYPGSNFVVPIST